MIIMPNGGKKKVPPKAARLRIGRRKNVWYTLYTLYARYMRVRMNDGLDQTSRLRMVIFPSTGTVTSNDHEPGGVSGVVLLLLVTVRGDHNKVEISLSLIIINNEKKKKKKKGKIKKINNPTK